MQAVPFFEAMALVTFGCSAASVLATTRDRVTRFHLEMNKTSMHQYNYINCEFNFIILFYIQTGEFVVKYLVGLLKSI